jgi:hypothetical protein
MSIERLKELQKSMAVKHTFNVGDIVKWKDGMNYKKGDGPFVVIEVLDNPITDEERSSGTPYFKNKLDIVLGSVLEGDFVCYYHESCRFEPVE